MSYSIIAAIGKNNELGANNKLIWDLPNDLKFFKEKTNGKTIIMGRKTFESLPRILPNRTHVVLSSNDNLPKEVICFKTLEELFQKYNNHEEELFVIGGGSVYRAFLEYATKLYLTEIDAEYKEADTYFPEFEKNDYEKEFLGENEDNQIKYKHILYKRK